MERPNPVTNTFILFLFFAFFWLTGCGDSGLGLEDNSSSSNSVSSSAEESSSSATSSSVDMSSSDISSSVDISSSAISSSETSSSSMPLDERLFGCWKEIDYGVGASDWQRVFSLGSDGSVHFEVAEMGDTCSNNQGMWYFESDSLFMLFPEDNTGDGCQSVMIPDTIKIGTDSVTSEAIHYNPLSPINKMETCPIAEAGLVLSSSSDISSSGTSSSGISSSSVLSSRLHADVIVTSSLTDSLWVMDYDGTNMEQIPSPFPTESVIANQVVISKDSTYFFGTNLSGADSDSLWIMDDLQGTNAQSFPMPNMSTVPDMHMTEAGELILLADDKIYELNFSTGAFDEIADLWEGAQIRELEFDSQGRMYAMVNGSILQYADKFGGTFTEIAYGDLVTDPENPDFTRFNGFHIDATTDAIYIDANYNDAYREDSLHTWIKLNGFNASPEAMIPGLDLGTNGGGAHVAAWNDSHFYAYKNHPGSIVYSSDPGAQDPLTTIISQGNILDIAIRR